MPGSATTRARMAEQTCGTETRLPWKSNEKWCLNGQKIETRLRDLYFGEYGKLPDWHLIAEKLVNGKDHYIGYYSALQIHELITQPSIKEQIVVAEQIRPSVIHIKTIPFQFIYHNATHFFGAKKTWIDSYHKVNCSDLEKTLIDCLFKPGYAGGIVEIAKAIHLSRNQIQNDKLLDYVSRFRSQAVIKRLGFLLELLEVITPVLDKLQEMKTDSYEVLDPELPGKGKHSRRWSIQQNLETETITSALYT